MGENSTLLAYVTSQIAAILGGFITLLAAQTGGTKYGILYSIVGSGLSLWLTSFSWDFYRYENLVFSVHLSLCPPPFAPLLSVFWTYTLQFVSFSLRKWFDWKQRACGNNTHWHDGPCRNET